MGKLKFDATIERGENKMLEIKHSQNYLYNKEFVKIIIEKCNLNQNDVVIEIGPGKGIITEALARVSKSVLAIELDQQHAQTITQLFRQNKKIKIIHMDFLKFPLPDEAYKIVSSIPYELTSRIFKKVLEDKNAPEEVFFIMQKEAAEKYAGVKLPSIKHLFYAPLYDFSVIMEIKKQHFKPTPKVDSVLLHMKKKERCDFSYDDYQTFKDFICFFFKYKDIAMKKVFSYKQEKMIRKNLKINDSIFAENYLNWKELFSVYKEFTSSEIKKKVDGQYKQYLQENETKEKIYRTRR